MAAILTEAPPVLRENMATSEALVRLARGRDADAWSAILLAHGEAIWRLAQRLTGDASLCDDVCQEALLQIREHAALFKPPTAQSEAEAAARGWIMCIAYRTALGMLRTRNRRNQTELQAGQIQQRASSSTRDSLLNAEELERVRSEIASLPELLRSAVSLHFYGEMSYPELSTALDCSEKAARKRVERGLHKLRDRLVAGGVAVSFGVLTLSLSTQANACGASGLSAAAPVSGLLHLQRLAQWQALLNHPAPPLLAGVAKTGGMVLMTKYLIGVAAALMLGVTTVQQVRTNALSRDISATQEQLAHMGELQNNVSALEQQIADMRGDTLALKASLSSRNDEITQLKSKLQTLEDKPNADMEAMNGLFAASRGLGNNAGSGGVTAAQISPALKSILDQVQTQSGEINGKTQQFTTKDGSITFSSTVTSTDRIPEIRKMEFHTHVDSRDPNPAPANTVKLPATASGGVQPPKNIPPQNALPVLPPKPPIDAQGNF